MVSKAVRLYELHVQISPETVEYFSNWGISFENFKSQKRGA